MTDKLMPMTEFMLQKEQQVISESNARIKAFSSTHLNECFAYAKFLKQPLTLGMFVPVSEAGEVLKGKPLSPAPDAEWIRWENEEEEYNKAKSRCLFEGFDGFEKSYVSDGLYFLVNKQENVECILSDTYSIENLVDMDLTLTPYAKELIYGKHGTS